MTCTHVQREVDWARDVATRILRRRETPVDLLAVDPCMAMRAQGLEPDGWQRDLLEGFERAAFLLCARQMGKSRTAGALAAVRALTVPRSTVLLVSPSLRQSTELFDKVMEAYVPFERNVPARHMTAHSLRLVNGSRVVSLPESERTVRGFSAVDLLVIDEASRVPDAMYYTLRPMLAVSRGRLVAMSTPFGRRGWFYQEWDRLYGRPDVLSVKAVARQCPRYTQEFLDGELAALGPRWFAQEYECEFSAAEGCPFDPDAIDAALVADHEGVELMRLS